eukprot:CAMPEP_0172485840 /NCGR_PEP_ID=MMETSP1066-20121228/14077_1 /TAXON_ID=671091 /ORGANISM="Coscinodiscus wailesii, Strain CCMP2513" /LENGTH=340 /DNA_ID=CAMNT_0013251363 /DNA_START=47 /DNA_END=1066 /DNA_ORIENTATION=+
MPRLVQGGLVAYQSMVSKRITEDYNDNGRTLKRRKMQDFIPVGKKSGTQAGIGKYGCVLKGKNKRGIAAVTPITFDENKLKMKRIHMLEHLANAAATRVFICQKLDKLTSTSMHRDLKLTTVNKPHVSVQELPQNIQAEIINQNEFSVAKQDFEASKANNKNVSDSCASVETNSLSSRIKSHQCKSDIAKKPHVFFYKKLAKPYENDTSALSNIQTSLYLQPAPKKTRLPTSGRVPKLCDMDATVARKIIIAFEEKVIDMEAGVVYSPLRLWATSERRKVNLKDSNFTVRCVCYYAIRKVLVNHDPDGINFTTTQLRRIGLESTSKKRSEFAISGKPFYW